jgi:hypothetical protein
VAQGVCPEFKPQYCKKTKRKYLIPNRAYEVVQVVECLPSKPEVLSSNSSIAKNIPLAIEYYIILLFFSWA